MTNHPNAIQVHWPHNLRLNSPPHSQAIILCRNCTPNYPEQHQNHHCTQLYVQLQDDPLPATIMNHAITTPNTLKTCLLHQTSQTSATGKSHNNRAINNNATDTNDPPLSTLALHNGTITALQIIGHNGEKLPNLATPTVHIDTLVKPLNLNTTVQTFFAQLDYIEAYLCALMHGITPLPTSLTTKLYDINTSNHQAPSLKLHIQPDSPITSQTHTTSDDDDITPCHPDLPLDINMHHPQSHNTTWCNPVPPTQNIPDAFNQMSSSFCLTLVIISTCRLPHALIPTCHATNLAHFSMMSHQSTEHLAINPYQPTQHLKLLPILQQASPLILLFPPNNSHTW